MKHEHNQISETMDYDEMKWYVPRETREQFEEIAAGRRLPELYYDRPFKRIFDADLHPERVQTLFRLIFGHEDTVEGSVKTEMTHASIYSKQTILDLLSRLGSGGLLDLEMQVTAQKFLFSRVQIYASDMLLLQYSINRGERKAERHFDNVEQSYFVVLMKKDIGAFQSSRSFLHRERRMTDTGFVLPSLIDIVYIELDKCLRQWEVDSCPEEYTELALWLCAIADINHPRVQSALARDRILESVQQELAVMAKDRKELSRILFEKYAEDIRNSEIASARKEGIAQGHANGCAETLNRIQLLITRMTADGAADQLSKLSDVEFLEQMCQKYQV